MSRPFGKDKLPNKKRPRNTFDLSFVNNLTTDFGKLTPFCVKEVLPGDSAEIDLGVALRAMPMVFPVQTNMRVDMHMFYVRNRNLWKDFTDFYGDLKEGLVAPYLTNLTDDNAGIGQLHDYLGLPNTVVGSKSGQILASSSSYLCADYRPTYTQIKSIDTAIPNVDVNDFVSLMSIFSSGRPGVVRGVYGTSPNCFTTPEAGRALNYGFTLSSNSFDLSKESVFRFIGGTFVLPDNDPVFRFLLIAKVNNSTSYSPFVMIRCNGTVSTTNAENDTLTFSISGLDLSEMFSTSNTGSIHLLPIFPAGMVSFAGSEYGWMYNDKHDLLNVTPSNPDHVSELYKGAGSLNPFLPQGDKAPEIPVSALPARAYESIYNAFYRDERNNPYILNGQKEYNKFLPTTEGGADDNNYTIRYRNWEQDFLTTATQSPQQGNAPLVGITSGGIATFSDPENGKRYQVQLTTAEDGDHVSGVQYREVLPTSVMRSLVDVVSSGISINDFRNVNAFQRWLETNIRKGFKFRDIIGAHFGVEPSYAELDMPEFIGGHSEIINISQVTQTSESTSSSPLGSYAGQGYAFGRSKHKIRRYFDEPGFLIGILSISPIPNYSQLLPKFYLKRDVLDYFWPEFGHIGMQPITYREVCPIQSKVEGTSLTDVFGYQRAWYDYLQSVDEVHGEFRTTLRDFLINRVFSSRPNLSPDFLTIKPEQTNNIWSVNETNDKFIGLVNVGLTMKRTIPKYGIPKLEA